MKSTPDQKARNSEHGGQQVVRHAASAAWGPVAAVAVKVQFVAVAVRSCRHASMPAHWNNNNNNNQTYNLTEWKWRRFRVYVHKQNNDAMRFEISCVCIQNQHADPKAKHDPETSLAMVICIGKVMPSCQPFVNCSLVHALAQDNLHAA